MEQKGSSSVFGLSRIKKFGGKNYKFAEPRTPPARPQDEIQEVRDKDGKVIIAGLSADEPSKKYIDYMWRYHEAVRMIFISLEWSLELYVKIYSLHIQELIDEYQAGAEDPSDKISERDHMFFPFERRTSIKVLGKDPEEVIKKLCYREDSIKNSKGIPSDVALYTKSGGFATGTKKKDTGKPDAKKDKKDKKDKKEKRVCCEKEGHLEEKCWAKHGNPDWKKDKSEETEDKEDTDKKSSTATANLTSTSTIGSLWMAVEDSAVTMGNFYLEGVCDAHACNRRDLFDSKTFVELKEGDRKVRGFDGLFDVIQPAWKSTRICNTYYIVNGVKLLPGMRDYIGTEGTLGLFLQRLFQILDEVDHRGRPVIPTLMDMMSIVKDGLQLHEDVNSASEAAAVHTQL
ncbi:hypothetical protein FN846DRAFT_997467 [Sphaerosporella brunnea]|uniref:Uncharacterized protein n=1 Tax=Sphaerosporella brunnea TaxID=1250544 RepID=A0A5J5EIX7_9PEZI|nr:hypothetical protein FN846DRAFT_997467 [Sphaerosporella brunnea]